MKCPARLLLLIGIGGIACSAGFIPPGALHAEDTHRVQIVIRNGAYELHGGSLKPNWPATISIRNADRQAHGFTSPLFAELELQVETRAGETFGKGIRGVHINHGESMTLRFTPVREGQFKFQCDLHPGMKGELLILFVGEV